MSSRMGSFLALALGAGLISACAPSISVPGGQGGQPSGGQTGGQNGGVPGGSGGASTGSGSGGSATGGSGTATGSGGRGPTGTGGSGTGGATGGVGGSGADVCARWTADRANLSEGTWSGAVASCTAGDLSADARANALRLVNLYRWLAALPPVDTDPTRNQNDQACALMMRANNMLSHTPPNTWTCWTQAGADGAGSSNISGGQAVSSVDSYMIDSGNATTIGHRRWILSNSLGPIGIGGTDRSSCLWTLSGTGRAAKPWMAWPAAGVIPLQAMVGARGGQQSVDVTGWTVQSDTINLAGAQVAVLADGVNQPVTVTQLDANYGSRYAIRFNPTGWTTQAGRTYAVAVTGITPPINYTVQVVSCL
jgi:uncharacterized protein YkwD